MGSEYHCNNVTSFNHATVGTAPNLDNVKVHVTNFTWHVQSQMPNNQSKEALNELLEDSKAIVKSYITQTHIVTKEHNRQTTTQLDNDIFNGNLPYKIFFCLRRDNFNWTSVDPRIKNSQQAYWHLQKALHLTNHPMPFTYEEYENDFDIIGLELCATEDSNLKTSPLKPEGNLYCSITFTAENVNLVCYYIGIFPNQFNSPHASISFIFLCILIKKKKKKLQNKPYPPFAHGMYSTQVIVRPFPIY